MLEEFKDYLTKCSEGNYPEILGEYFGKFDIPYFAYTYIYKDFSYDYAISIKTNYPEQWVSIYTDRKLHKLDPVITTAAHTSSPFEWENINKKHSEIFIDSKNYGISQGFTIPFHDPGFSYGAINLSAPEDYPNINNLIKKNFETIITLSYFAHIYRPLSMQTDTGMDLNENERECLHWASLGKTCHETSLIMNICERTVKYHLSTAMTKLNACNIKQAIALAIWRDYL